MRPLDPSGPALNLPHGVPPKSERGAPPVLGVLAILGALALTPAPSPAQRAMSTIGPRQSSVSSSPDLNDVAYTAFGRRDGLPDTPIYSLTRARDGSVLIGTADRARHFTGRSWAPLPLPPSATDGLIRFVLDASPHERYYLRTRGISVERDGQWAEDHDIPAEAAPIYSAALESRADGPPRVVIGSRNGVFVIGDDRRLQRMVLPGQRAGRGAMVATRTIEGQDELWIATEDEGILRHINGQWTVWNAAQGLTDLRVEHIALSPAGDSASAVVATESGAFLLVGERWHHIGPQISTARVLRVRIRDTIETWIGATSGHVYRSRDGRSWQTLELSPRALGSRVQMLEAVDHGLGYPSIYIGFRSGALLRLTVGVAGQVPMPARFLGYPIVAVTPQRDGDTLWFWAMNLGALRLPDFHSLPAADIARGPGDQSARIFLDTRSRPTRLFAAFDWRVFERVHDAWMLRFDIGDSDAVRQIIEAPVPGGARALVVIGSRGAWFESAPSRFTPWSGFPSNARAATVDSTEGTPHLVVALANGTLQWYDGNRWQELPGGAAPVGGPIAITSVRLASGECVLVVGGTDGISILRTCGGPAEWRIFDTNVLAGLLSDDVTDLALLPDSRLAIGSSRGLTLTAFGAAFGDSVTVVDSYTDQDGLPHPHIGAIGPLDSRGRLWLGTPLGIAYVNMDGRPRQHARPTLSLVEIRNGAGIPIAQGSRVAHADARVEITAYAMTFHREEETLYRFELDDTPITTPAWTDRGSATLPTLAPGRHTIRVRAVDYRGFEAISHETQFVVLPPPWRSPAALIAYGVLLLGVGITVDRRRNRSALLRAREAEENERRLATSEQRFRRLFEDGANPQLLVADGVVLKANRAATMLWQVDTQPLVGRPLASLIPAMPSPGPATNGSDLGAHGANGTAGTLPQQEVDVIDDRQERIPVEVRHTRIPLEDAVLDHFELRDLRERKRLEEERRELESQLRDAQRLESMGTLAGGVAHDFNNLLTVIHTNAELAVDDIPSASPASEALQQLLVASRRAREVVRQILTFSRRTELRQEAVPLSALLTETHSLLRSTIPSTIQLVIRNQAPEATVLGDATQLQQLVLNLCSNAEYAMRATKGGTLTIGLRWLTESAAAGSVEWVVLSVQDTGVGMTPDVRGRIFEPFFTTKPVGHGTGLGLSVLHGIVTSHGGMVNVTSDVGRGTTIDVHLPASRMAHPLPSAVPVRTKGALARRHHILLVDDEAAVAGAIERLLAKNDFAVTVATNGAEALDLLSGDATFDLILTDQTMPVMTGIELMERLRADGNTTPIVLASGFGAAIDADRIAHLRDIHRIDKPFASADLLQLVRTVLATR